MRVGTRSVSWNGRKSRGREGQKDCLELVLFGLGLADQVLRISNSRGCGRGERGGAHSLKFFAPCTDQKSSEERPPVSPRAIRVMGGGGKFFLQCSPTFTYPHPEQLKPPISADPITACILGTPYPVGCILFPCLPPLFHTKQRQHRTRARQQGLASPLASCWPPFSGRYAANHSQGCKRSSPG
jgi:hypothetical protein